MASNDLATLAWKSEVGADIDQDVFYLGLLVPPGRRCFIASRTLKLTENEYDVDVVVAANGFTGGTEGTYSLLREGGVDAVQSRVYGGVTPLGDITVIQPDITVAGVAPGTAAPPAAQNVDTPLRSWVSSPLIRITRVAGGTPYRASINVLAYEEES